MPNLCELYLSNNQLGVKDDVDWRWLLSAQISQKLKLLDISGNQLKYLPKPIWKLQKLVTLKLDNNLLDRLPTTLGRMSSLRHLTMTQNRLTSLPCGLLQCRLEYIDLSENQLDAQETTPEPCKSTPWEFYIGSLVDITSKVVLKNKFYYAPNIIPWTLVEFLDNANMCVCGAPVVNNRFYMNKEFQLRDYFHVVVFNSNRKNTVTFQCYFCSHKCLNR
ncbi:unnamed protein product [Chrysodeixis includens]|uniref:Leucine rich repeat protein n=1 Tax=Chrysodeixis includens TaxID=689277 RepID=A0A9N8Q120_CHRIL|nr:unnamed protein product [Chrysodeixis includens]